MVTVPGLKKLIQLSSVIWFCLITVFHGQAQEQKDSIIFYREQMILGELLSIDAGRISFDSDDAGVLSIKNYKIKTLSANIHLYRIRTSDQRLIFGKVHKSVQAGFIRVEQGSDTVEIPITSVIELERFDTKFGDRLSGKLSAGYNFTKSSDIGRLNIDFSISYQAQTYESTVTASSIMTQAEEDFSRDIESVTSSNVFNLSYRWMVVGLLSYQRNLELGILRRFQEAALLGYNLTTYSNRQLSTGIGVAVNQELTEDNTSSRNLVEVPLVIAFRFYKFQEPNIQIRLDQKVYFGVTESGRIRNDANLAVDWEIISDFTLGISVYSNYDNMASESSTSNFDYGLVFNVGYKF